MPALPCFLCGKQLDQRTDKNRKPYFVCDPCGAQIFVRRRQGIENLSELIKTLRQREFQFRQRSQELFEIQALLSEMRGIKDELQSLDGMFDLFKSEKDKREKERTRESLNEKIDSLLSQLEQIAHRDAQS